MAVGMRVRWLRGPRTTTTAKGKGGVEQLMRGKNGGPIIKQTVTKHLVPKEA